MIFGSYVLAISGSFFLNGIIVWPFVKRYVDFVRPTACEIMTHLKGNLGLFVCPSSRSEIYTTILSKITLGVRCLTEEQVAFFSYSERISRLPLSVLQALGVVICPVYRICLWKGRGRRRLT